MAAELKRLETRSLASVDNFDINISDRERRKMMAIMARMGVKAKSPVSALQLFPPPAFLAASQILYLSASPVNS